MMRRHAELLVVHMGEERGCKEFRKHVSWYLKGFPVGGDLRRDLALVSTLASSTGCSDGSTRTAEFPVAELGTPRGRQGSPRRAVALPEGWLEDTDGTGCVVREEASGDHRRLSAWPRAVRRAPRMRGVSAAHVSSLTHGKQAHPL